MITFLDKKTVIAFHQDLIETYGGRPGIRDEKLLESALSQPRATIEGEHVHENIFQMAAAYGFHICRNHPFFDGNKRVALIAMYTFLYVNGYRLEAGKKSLYAIIIDLAKGNVGKDELVRFLKEHSKER